MRLELHYWAPAERLAPALDDETVHVWSVDLDDAAWPVDALRRLLDAPEAERCERLQTAELRRRFVVRRGLLRTLLGAYAGRAPGALRLRSQSRGKPELDPAENDAGLQFNVSDCGGRALYAVTRAGAVGVDIEAVAPIPDMARVARRWFAADEQAALANLPEEQRARGFYLAWTRKEAVIKAEGTGLTLPLDRFSVSLAPGDAARLLHTSLPRLAAFTLSDIALDEPFVAACAVDRGGR